MCHVSVRGAGPKTRVPSSYDQHFCFKVSTTHLHDTNVLRELGTSGEWGSSSVESTKPNSMLMFIREMHARAFSHSV